MAIPEGDNARTLGSIVNQRREMLTMLHKGNYDDALELGREVLRDVQRYFEEYGDRHEILPHGLQVIALLGDLSFAALASGRHQEAADFLTSLTDNVGTVSSVTDAILKFSGVVCEHGNPSLDGECLKKPPCPVW